VSNTPRASTTGSRLVRCLGPLDGAGIVVSNVIGGGIFFLPAIVAQSVAHPWWMVGVWVAGGALAFTGAMAYAELAAFRPRAGGEYVYLREAFGPLAAFLTGWTSFVAGFSGAIAASAVALTSYLGRFLPAASNSQPLAAVALGPLTLSVSPRAIVALTVIVSLTAVHVVGIGPGRLVQNLLAGMKIALLVVFVGIGFTLGKGSWEPATSGFEPVSGSSWLLALLPVMFAYSGWNAAAYLAEEVKDPERNVPLALGLGTVMVVAIYVMLNLLYLYALPVAEFAMVDGSMADAAAERLFGSAVAVPIAAASIVMIAASISAMVFAGPRIYFAMAQDGQFFPAAARVHSRFRTPATAIVAQSLWASLLVLTGTFQQLVDYTAFAVVLFAGVAVTALFVLRFRNPVVERPFKAWGYPLAPFVFVVTSAAMVVNSIWRNPVTSAAGLLVISAGVPLYLLMRRWR